MTTRAWRGAIHASPKMFGRFASESLKSIGISHPLRDHTIDRHPHDGRAGFGISDNVDC